MLVVPDGFTYLGGLTRPVELATETTDLGDGLTGAMVLSGDPVADAPACGFDPCPMG